MQKLLNKVAPLGMMTICTIWCCWSQLREATPLLMATETKLPRVERKLLHPELSPVSERDPFLQHKPAPPPAIEATKVPVQVARPSFDPQTVLPSIRLDATILGAKPLAVINGKIRKEGEMVVLEAASEVRCRLQSVHSDGIEMTIEGHTFLIGYANTSRKVTELAHDTASAAQLPGTSENQLPPGIPNADELETAVSDSLTAQSLPTDGHGVLNFEPMSDLSLQAADDGCEFKQDELNINKLDELLNYDDE